MWAVSVAYILIVLHVRGFARVSFRFEPAFFRQWLVASLPFAMTFVITTIYFKADQPILKLFRPYSEVGLYIAAYKPFEALLFVPVAMLNVIYPVLALLHREAPERLVPGIERFFRLLLLIGWPISVGIVVLAHGLTQLMWGAHYPGAEVALAILGAGVFMLFVNNAFIAALNSIDRQLSFTWASVAAMVANVALNFALIPPFGYIGASLATVATEAVLLGAAWWLVRRHLATIDLARLGWRIVLAGAVMGAVLLPFRGVTGLWVLGLVAGGALVYGAAVLLLRAFSEGEWDMVRRAVAR
jgi:O-antigen/teichoic acid export membrane protein